MDLLYTEVRLITIILYSCVNIHLDINIIYIHEMCWDHRSKLNPRTHADSNGLSM